MFQVLIVTSAFNRRFLETGVYQKTPATLTIAPSMDISVSSNFERYLFYLAGSSSDTLKSWMDAFEGQGEIKVPAELLMVARSELASYSSSKSDIVSAMRDVFDREKYLVCPHTATAVVAVRELGLKASRTVILATAHPAKFEEAVALALVDGRVTPARPKILNDLFVMPTRSTHLPNSLAEIESFVRSKIGSTKKKSAGGLIQASSVFTVAALGVGIYVTYAFATKRGR
jgi:threonine synthase